MPQSSLKTPQNRLKLLRQRFWVRPKEKAAEIVQKAKESAASLRENAKSSARYA